MPVNQATDARAQLARVSGMIAYATKLLDRAEDRKAQGERQGPLIERIVRFLGKSWKSRGVWCVDSLQAWLLRPKKRARARTVHTAPRWMVIGGHVFLHARTPTDPPTRPFTFDVVSTISLSGHDPPAWVWPQALLDNTGTLSVQQQNMWAMLVAGHDTTAYTMQV